MADFKFDHIHLYSSDPLKTSDFYVKLLGAQKRGSQTDPKGRTVVDVVLNGILIKISQPWDAATQGKLGLDHFGMVTDNLDSAIAELKAQGVDFVMEKTPLPGAYISFFNGPEKVLIEVIEEKQKA